MKEKNMFMSLFALQYTVAETSLFEVCRDGSFSLCSWEKSSEANSVKYSGDCLYIYNEGKYSIIYDEREDDGASRCRTELVFDGDQGEIIKNGGVSTRFLIRKGSFEQGEYVTPIGTMKLGTLGLSIKNMLGSDGGCVLLDYVSEICGCDAQRIKMKIEIKSEARDI